MMKTPMLGLRTCIYKVKNLELAKNWYTDAFQQSPYFDEPFYVGFNIAGYELGLLPEEDTDDEPSNSVLTYWGVENIEKEFDRMIELGATVHEKPNNVGGDIVVASVYDPWSNLIGLIYNPHFKLPKQ